MSVSMGKCMQGIVWIHAEGARASLGLESDKKIDSGFQWIDKNTIGLEEYARYLY